ncbi:MAG: FliH/SctL family protein [Syntrophomonadaceae bacterium]
MSSKVIKRVNNRLEYCWVYPRAIPGRKELPEKMEPTAAQSEEDIIAQAHEAAGLIIQQAQAKGQVLEQEAYEKGYQQGYNEGLKKAETETQNLYTTARAVLEEVNEVRRQVFLEAEVDLVQLAIKIAEKLVCRQLELKPDTIVDIVKEACNQARDCQQVVIYVAPHQVETLRARQQEIAAKLYASEKIHFIADPLLKAGDCKIETEQGCIDATLTTMLEQLNGAIKGRA